jgi:DegV family protein with EDD domain
VNLSTGIGILVVEAAIMAKEGLSAEEIVKEITRLRPKVRASFVIDTLTYLARGGRCSSVAALTGGVLRIHPKVIVKDGKMEVSKKYRGPIKRVVMDYVKDMHYALLEARPARIFITHTSSDRELVEEVRTYLESLNYFDEILETSAGGVISSHCGPGTLGVLFIEG